MHDIETTTAQFQTTFLNEAVSIVMAGAASGNAVAVTCDNPSEAAELMMELNRIDAFSSLDPAKLTITVAANGVSKTAAQALDELSAILVIELLASLVPERNA